MQIKLSKNQWEAIGVKAKWLKSAQANHSSLQEFWQIVLKQIGGNKYADNDPLRSYSEFHMYDVYGECWVQVYYDESHNSIRMEKYYQSEFLQNEFGKFILLPIDVKNPSQMVNKIKSILEKWKTE